MLISRMIAFCKQRDFERVISRKWGQNRMKRAPTSSTRRVTRFPRLVNPPRIGSRENTRTNAVFGRLSPFALSPPEVAKPTYVDDIPIVYRCAFKKYVSRIHLLYTVVALVRKPNREKSIRKVCCSFSFLKCISSVYHLISCSGEN